MTHCTMAINIGYQYDFKKMQLLQAETVDQHSK